jgi:hypothetical protein
MKWENKFLVFVVARGPKVIIESLDTYGKEGWELNTILPIGSDQLVAFLKRRYDIVMPDPQKAERDKIKTLWSDESDEE